MDTLKTSVYRLSGRYRDEKNLLSLATRRDRGQDKTTARSTVCAIVKSAVLEERLLD